MLAVLAEVLIEAPLGQILSAALGVPVLLRCPSCGSSALFGRLFGVGTALNVSLNWHLGTALGIPPGRYN